MSRPPASVNGHALTGTPGGPERDTTARSAGTAWAPDSPRAIRARLVVTIAGFGALAVVTCLLAPLVGSTTISLARVFDRSIPFEQNVDAQIFFVARLPRVVAAAIVGAALASAGVVFQALLRNPLATPFTLGVSAGASLGAMLAIIFGTSLAFVPFSIVPLASLIGFSRRTARSPARRPSASGASRSSKCRTEWLAWSRCMPAPSPAMTLTPAEYPLAV